MPIAEIMAGAGALASIFGGMGQQSAQRSITRRANAELARILPVQRQEFNRRYDLSTILNNILLGNEASRYNQVGEAEVGLRGSIGDESVARFDEQAAAVSGQTAENRTAMETLMAEINQSITNNIGLYEGELGRQRGFQGQADSARAALLPTIGATADAVSRAGFTADRVSLADSAISAADGTAYSAPAAGDTRITGEFERQADAARDFAVDVAGKDAAVGAYGDARSAESRTLNSFNDAIAVLTQKANISEGALTPELAASGMRGTHALEGFNEGTSLSRTVADNTIRLSDRNRGGRIAAMDAAGSADIDSLSNFFARLADSYRGGYGGQIGASERYESGFTNLINSKAARIAGQSAGTSPLSSIGKLLTAFSGIMPAPAPRG